jgi:hypothetical protein
MGLWGISDANKDAMQELIGDGLLDVYVSYIDQPNWGTQAINVLSSLLIDRSFEIEPVLLREEAVQKIRDGVNVVGEKDTPSFVRPLKAICERSVAFVERLVDPTFVHIIVGKFARQHGQSQLPAAMLELICAIFKSGEPGAVKRKSREGEGSQNRYCL